MARQKVCEKCQAPVKPHVVLREVSSERVSKALTNIEIECSLDSGYFLSFEERVIRIVQALARMHGRHEGAAFEGMAPCSK